MPHPLLDRLPSKTISTRPVPDVRVVRWLRDHEREFAVDPIILGEVRFGILLLARGNRRTELERWFDSGVQRVQCIAWEAETGLAWAALVARLRKSGRSMPIKDSLIAASAIVHDLTVVTRNVNDFKKAGVRVLNLFQDA